MKRTIILLLALLVVISLVFSGGAEEKKAKDLIIITWGGGYVQENNVAEFEEQTGYKIKATFVDNNNEIISKLRAAPDSADIVQPDLDNIYEAIEWKLYQPIDIDKIPNIKYIDPKIWDSLKDIPGAYKDGKYYCIPFNWGAEGIIYDSSVITEKIDSYRPLFDEKYTDKITYRCAYPPFVATGLYLGYDMTKVITSGDKDNAQEVFNKIFEFLKEKKPLVKTYWTSGDEQVSLFTTVGVVVGKGWASTYAKLVKIDKKYKWALPKEKALTWMGTLAIPTGSKNVEGAHEWINFMLEPKHMARYMEEDKAMSVVPKAVDMLSQELKDHFNYVYPPGSADLLWWYPALPSWLNDMVNQLVQRLRAE